MMPKEPTQALMLPVEVSQTEQHGQLGRRPGWAFGAGFLILFGCIVPLYFTDAPLSVLTNAPVLLAIMVLLWSTTEISRTLLRGDDKPVQLVFWIFVYVWFGLAALGQTASGRFPIAGQTFSEDVQFAGLATIIVGLVGYRLGVAIVEARSARPSLLGKIVGSLELRRQRATVVGIVGVAFVTLFTIRFGLTSRFSSRAEVTNLFISGPADVRADRRTNKTGGLIAVALDWVPVFMALYCMVSWWRAKVASGLQGKRPRLRLPSRLAIGLFVVANVLASNPVINPRYRAGGVLIALALAAYPLANPRRVRLFGAGLLVAMIVVFPFADYFRNDTRQVERTSTRELLVVSPDYGMYQQELNSRVYVAENGFTFGRQTAGVVFAIVPRALWPGKPIDTGNLVSRTDAINASASLWATMYVDGGRVLVFLALAGFGALSAAFEGLYRNRGQHIVSFVSLAVPLFVAFEIFVLRGDLQPAVGELLPVALICFAVCARGRRR